MLLTNHIDAIPNGETPGQDSRRMGNGFSTFLAAKTADPPGEGFPHFFPSWDRLPACQCAWVTGWRPVPRGSPSWP
jgi:hypothetical protein